MSQTEFTHLWHEAPILSDALSLIPANVTLLQAPKGDPTANLAQAQAILASSGLTYDGPLMDLAPNLRIIARTGIGVDNVDLAAATERGILVCNTPDGPTESTAEHTVAMLLALAKMLKQGDANVAAGNFGPRGILLGMEVQGKTLGLVGMGRIGRRVAHICRFGLGMTVLAYDPFITQTQVDDLGVTLADLDTVIGQAHFLSLHAPSTPETVKLMNAARFAQMRDGAYLLNMARGTLGGRVRPARCPGLRQAGRGRAGRLRPGAAHGRLAPARPPQGDRHPPHRLGHRRRPRPHGTHGHRAGHRLLQRRVGGEYCEPGCDEIGGGDWKFAQSPVPINKSTNQQTDRNSNHDPNQIHPHPSGVRVLCQDV